MKTHCAALAALALITLTACDPAGGLSNEPVQVVTVEGVETGVQALTASPNTFAAAPTDLTGGLLDPAVWARNGKAIELVTGCTIVPASVANKGLQTLAQVDC